MEDDLVEAYRLLMADVYELAGASRRTSEAIARDIGGQTTARWQVLSVVSDGPRPVPAIARRLGLTRQSVQRVVDHLSAEGLSELRANPAHRRSPLVALTPRGEASLTELNAANRRRRRTQLDGLAITSEQLHRARATIRTLLAALDAPAGAPAEPPPR